MPTYEENVKLASGGKSTGNQMIPDMAALMGRPLTIGEERTVWHAWEEHNAIETEGKRLVKEREKILLEGEQLKQTLIARAIESMTPGWERGGQRVDVGGFSQGGAPMQQVAVGPGQPGREITPATGPGVQYRQPGAEQQRMGQQLVRKEMGLTPEDPMDVFDRQIQAIQEKEKLRGQAARKTEEFRVGLETKKEAAGLTKLGEIEKAKTLAAETQETSRLHREVQLKFEDNLGTARKEYDKAVNTLKKDPMFRSLPAPDRNSQLAELQDQYESWIEDVARRGKRYGIDLDTSEFIKPKNPSVLNQEQIDWYKGADKKQKRAFDKAYEDRFGKKHGMGSK